MGRGAPHERSEMWGVGAMARHPLAWPPKLRCVNMGKLRRMTPIAAKHTLFPILLKWGGGAA
jgi:hypothetical protein